MIKCHVTLGDEPRAIAYMPALPREGEALITADQRHCHVTRVTWELTQTTAEAHLELVESSAARWCPPRSYPRRPFVAGSLLANRGAVQGVTVPALQAGDV